MAYQALLFCPEEKTARTVTQVLGELEFQVEPCTEPFAAVKKLMGQHFDAVVVDCDNEQNATLLFKSARNSTSNQASLAVAIVEGQAGVAKAFRIGANLVLTKPINVEQSKGTLRVARGLLRKGEPAKVAPPTPNVPATPAKPAAAVTSAPANPTKPAPPRPAAPVQVKTETPVAPVTTAAPRPAAPPVAKPSVAASPTRTVAAPAAKTASSIAEAGSSKAANPPATVTPAAIPTPAVSRPPAAPAIPEAISKAPETPQAAAGLRPKFVGAPEGPVGMFGSAGAASAPAPAREVPLPPKIEATAQKTRHAAEDLFDKPAQVTAPAPAITGYAEPATEAAPSFTFGGASELEQGPGPGKKFLLIAVFMLAVVGVYLGWDYFQGRPSKPATPASVPATTSSPKQPTGSQPAEPIAKPAASTASTSQPESSSAAKDITLTSTSGSSESGNEPTSTPAPASKSASSISAPERSAASATPAEAPLVVKGGSAPHVARAIPAPDTAAPTVVGIAATGSDGALSKIVGGGSAPQPVLQTLNISQGVSSGLVLKRVQPVYPKAALALRVEGSVELQATISKSGAITGVKVLKGDAQLSRAAVEAVKQWKYKPYLLNGEPVEIQTQVTVNFRLPH